MRKMYRLFILCIIQIHQSLMHQPVMKGLRFISVEHMQVPYM